MPTVVRERYEVLDIVGSGGEARIVKALDRQHGRVVALKVRQVRDDAAREDLLAEARVLLALPPHPALPIVREDFFDGDSYVVAMDWVEGTDLGTLLAERGRPGLAPSSVLSYLAQAAEALAHLHAQSPPVIHGDVKPSNLILTTGGQIKLVDFGLSSAPIVPRRRAGTPGYRAPELAAGDVPTRASDVYALAATAFALLVGAPPAGVLPTWTGMPREQAEQLEAAIRRGMATHPARRPKTPGELVERLRAGWAAALPTGTVTLCLSAIADAAALWDADAAAMSEALVRHQELIGATVAAHGGNFVSSSGDGTVSVFDSAPAALAGAVEAARALGAEPWPDGLRVAVAWGLHTGEAKRRGMEYSGSAPSVGERVRAQAEGGQILLSAATADLVTGHLPDGCSVVDLGPGGATAAGDAGRVHALAGPGLRTPLGATQSPYPGLPAFEPEDRGFFFGREHVVREILAGLGRGRLLALVGASGSGKSSVLRAGVVAAVRAGEVEGLRGAELITPGTAPALDVDDAPERLLVVDQFEEIFTLCDDARRRDAFMNAVLAREGPVAIGMRADFYGHLAVHPRLARAAAAEHVLLGAMSDEELQRAITEPARLAGLRLQDGLVELLVLDVAGEPGALPLLSHALRATWERRDGRTLTVAGYRATGGVAGALAHTADAVVAELTPEDRRLARNVFVRLTELGEGGTETRRRVSRDELALESGAVEPLLARLADARLVMLGDDTAEIAHEALVRAWPTLRRWLDEDREGIRVHRQLGDAARLWSSGGREPTDLYRGARLAVAADWARNHGIDLNATERAFLDASVERAEHERRSERRANRRLRAVLTATVLLLAVAVLAGAVSLVQRGRARAQALTADAERIGVQALSEPRLDRALLLARQGVALDDSLATRSNLLKALLRSPVAIRVMPGTENPPTALDLSPDGRTLAAGDNQGNVLFLDAATGRHAGRPYTVPSETSVTAVRFSPDGTRLAVAGLDSIDILDARTHRADRSGLVAVPPTSSIDVNFPVVFKTIAFSPDSRVLAADVIANESPRRAEIVRWDARTGRRLGRPRQVAPTPEPALVGFTASGRLVTASAADDATVIRDPATLRPLRRLRGGGTPSVLSPDRRMVAFGGADGSVRLLDLRTGNLRIARDRHAAAVTDLRFTPDSRTLLTTGADGLLIQWDVADGWRIATFTGHAGSVSRVAIAPNGRTAYSAGQHATVIAWDLHGDRRLDRPFSAPPRGALHFSSYVSSDPADLSVTGVSLPYRHLAVATTTDGASFAVPDAAGNVDVFDSRTTRQTGRISVSPGTQVSAVALAPNGRTVAATTVNGDVRFADLRTRRPLGPLQRPYVDAAWSLAFSGDGRWLATAGFGIPASLRLWDVHRMRIVTTGQLSAYAVAADVAFSPNDTKLAAPVHDANGSASSIEILSVPRLAPVKTLRAPAGRTLRFSPDGTLLVFGDDQGRVWFYDTRTWRPLGRPLAAHTRPVDTVDFNPDGHTLATTSDDGTTRLWDVASRRPIGAALPGLAGHDLAAAFVDGGTHLVTIQDNGRGDLWNIQPRSWARRACDVAGRALTRAEWNEALPTRKYAPACAAP